jgi:hypothetical protein
VEKSEVIIRPGKDSTVVQALEAAIEGVEEAGCRLRWAGRSPSNPEPERILLLVVGVCEEATVYVSIEAENPEMDFEVLMHEDYNSMPWKPSPLTLDYAVWGARNIWGAGRLSVNSITIGAIGSSREQLESTRRTVERRVLLEIV